ncbi:hypothetical protein D3C83_202190 [compost metagenome]
MSFTAAIVFAFSTESAKAVLAAFSCRSRMRSAPCRATPANFIATSRLALLMATSCSGV